MTDPLHIAKIRTELNIPEKKVIATLALLDEGSTVPFISRYRKEVTGSLDEVAVTAIRDRIGQLRELDKRREAILESIDKQGKLTEALKKKIDAAETMTVLEDLYLPYKPKRRTRATVAKEKGLEPLAELILQQKADIDPLKEAQAYVSEEKKVASVEEALAGARDIIAEWINEDSAARARMRELYWTQGVFHSKLVKGKEQEGQKFKDYFDWSEPVASAPSHRVLAMRRGEKEGFLMLRVVVPSEPALDILAEQFIKGASASSDHVRVAIEDSFKRLLSLSMETEIRLMTKQQADEEAIRVFADNLRQLLMAAPLGPKAVIGIDPGFRTGCKVIVVDQQGKLLINTTIYPTQSVRQQEDAEKIIRKLCEEYRATVIAIGNGTASRETEAFIRDLKIKDVTVILVNESGASIYSASDVAREEFPDYDLTVRGAVSIARRLQDPLAELVKIDPKSIGVGQYQHDVDQTKLKKGLDDVVISSVNQVGVELNTASKQLLMYVSGLGPALAQAIVEYRNQKGAFQSREEILAVPRLSTKAYEQAAGFLRIRNARNPLDSSAVHPERYPVVEKMAKDVSASVGDLIKDASLRQRIDIHRYVGGDIGLPTLKDIMDELAKPGRDPREQFETVEFAEGINTIDDLTPGMKLNGVVTNVTNFGAFVDIGVHHDGLVHISEMSDKFIKTASEIVQVAQKVKVTVVEVDKDRQRIALSMKANPGDRAPSRTRPDSASKPSQPSAKPAARPSRQQEKKSSGYMPFKDLKF